jgi:UDP-N-acetylmuramate dehydrogenase
MTVAAARKLGLVDRLPAVRGVYAPSASLSPMTWFRVGGPAEVLFRPADPEDLADFIEERPEGLSVSVVGVGSNLLVRDGGIPGITIRLSRSFSAIERVSDTRIRCGAAALDTAVAAAAREYGLAGLEFLRGIPGTVGGALRMNAGAFGGEIKQVFVEARALTPSGELVTLDADAMDLSYRHSAAPEDFIFLDAVFEGRPDDPITVAARMDAIVAIRETSQPVRVRTGGSTFKNPDQKLSGGRRAWELIDQAGCRGLRHGGAQVSEKHCNFLINTGAASAADLETLGEEVRRRVLDQFGVALEWEIRRVGIPRAARGGRTVGAGA